jgi:pyruvate dehydrogenase E1 component alpha subunit
MREVVTFAINCVGCIGPTGDVLGPMPAFAADTQRLRELYRAMVLTRTFDARAVALQRTGRLGTFASSLGQEAVMVGMASAMQPEDVLLPSFREQGAQILRGVSMVEILLYWGGDERGSDFQDAREDFPVCVPVGSHAPHAAGVALAFKLRAERRVAVCCFGDGATSKGDVYEAMNFAGVHALPLVFVINNNQWAISVSREHQSATRTLAQKAIACGFDGIQVDGNDVVSMHEVMSKAIEQARAGGGPTLVEALTYRLGDHTTADDASRYRDDAQVSQHWEQEPIARLRNYLIARDNWSKDDEEQVISDCAAQVEAASSAYLATATQKPSSMFDYLYEQLPAVYATQRAMLAEDTQDGQT